MPYNLTTKKEADYTRGLGEINEDNFHATYSAVVQEWFLTSIGCLVGPHGATDGVYMLAYIIVILNTS